MTALVSGHTLLVFAGIPLLVIAVVSLLVFAPSIAKGPRYRPGLSWWAPPIWIGGPDPEASEVAEALAALKAAPQLEAGSKAHSGAVSQTLGGASASW